MPRPRYKSMDVRCAECNVTWNELATEQEESDNDWECPMCGKHIGRKTMSMPKPLRKSYRDGHKRPGWEDMRRAAKLEGESFNLAPEDRAEHQKEINERRKIKR